MPLTSCSGFPHSTSLFLRRPPRVLLVSRGPDPLPGGEQIPCGSWSHRRPRVSLRPSLLESVSQYDANLALGLFTRVVTRESDIKPGTRTLNR